MNRRRLNRLTSRVENKMNRAERKARNATGEYLRVMNVRRTPDETQPRSNRLGRLRLIRRWRQMVRWNGAARRLLGGIGERLNTFHWDERLFLESVEIALTDGIGHPRGVINESLDIQGDEGDSLVVSLNASFKANVSSVECVLGHVAVPVIDEPMRLVPEREVQEIARNINALLALGKHGAQDFIPFDDVFQDGAQFAGDGTDDVNCRCAMLYRSGR